MAKVNINYSLKSEDETHIFDGKGIKNGNKITYNDNGVMTTITLGDVIFLERKKDYLIKLGFCINNFMKGTYIIPEGSLDVKTETKELRCEENHIKIIYSLKINNDSVGNFELNFNYSIDSNE